MIDTLGAAINLSEPLDVQLFERMNVSRAVSDEDDETAGAKIKYFLVRRFVEGRATPAVTYYPQTFVGPRLHVEVSLPKLLGRPLAVLGQDDVDSALDAIDEFLREAELSIRPIRAWRVLRIDYLWSWFTGIQTGGYISALHSVQLSNYERTPYDYGVVWKGSKGYRWVKFYDKTREMGMRRAGVLRFEVSNFKNAVRYTAQKEAKIEQVVETFTRRKIAYMQLRKWMNKIGILASDFGSRQVLEQQLVARYGSGAAQAKWVLDAYELYGVNAFKPPYSLMTKSTYYHWHGRLKEDGFIGRAAKGLPRLSFPAFEDFGLETFGEDWGVTGQRKLL